MPSDLFKASVPEDFSSTNIKKVCRVCLQIDTKLFSIFCDQIDKMILEFIPDKLDEHDNFPHQICQKCMQDIKTAYAFKKQIEYSHEIIKQMLNGKRLPRSCKKKNYQETNFSTNNAEITLNDHANSKSLNQCHICKRRLKRRDLLKRHLEKVHKFYEIDEKYDKSDNEDNKDKENTVTENSLQEVSFLDTEKVTQTSDESDHNDLSLEEKSNLHKLCNEQRSKSLQDTTYQCRICLERLASSFNLKFHLEKQHQLRDEDFDIKSKIMPLENTKFTESSGLLKLSYTQLKQNNDKGRELQENVAYLNCDNSSDCLENNSSTTSQDISKADCTFKSNKTRTKTINAYICHICEKEFSCRTTTRRHLKNIHKFENFEDNIWLSKVYQKTIEAKIYECEICKKVYAKTQDLFRHQLLHSGNPRAKPYSCTMCSKSFSRSNHLKTHVNGVHADLRPFKCSTCEKSFRRTEHLKRHILICSTGRKRRAKEPTEHRFPCDVCLRKFSTEKAVQDHIDLEHNETREFSCKYCSEKIIGSTEYRRHCKEHYKTSKQFLCSECGGSFRKLQDFKIHLKRHTGEKPFKCQYCDKAFLRPADQHAHERSHTGERNFKCTNCPKAFSTAYKLRVHMRIHTGERPYKCSYCPRAFAKTGDLKIHHKRRHTSERFYCDLCDLGFVQMFNLRQHKRQVHGIDEPPIRTNFVRKVQLPQQNSGNSVELENKMTNNVLLTMSQINETNKSDDIKNEMVCEF